MYLRSVKPHKNQSFILLGARGTGKSTFLQKQWLLKLPHLYIDLLLPEVEDRYRREPALLKADVLAEGSKIVWVVIDEIQKLPKLLDVVHHLIETTELKFALTGSSARKLKRGEANLLAGRATMLTFFPLTAQEMGPDFNLEKCLNWGSLPKVQSVASNEERINFLRSYALSYIKEEIQVEQLVRNLDPFRNFLEIAGLSSGKIINYTKIARDVGVDNKTVKNYFQILEETLLGFFLPAFHRSIRKSQLAHPKFYLFDIGVQKALSRSLKSVEVEGTSAFGNAFEHWVLQEIFRLNQYMGSDYRMSYYATKNGTEVDLILTRGRETILVEIKSAMHLQIEKVKKLDTLAKDFKATRVCYLSRDKIKSQYGQVECLHWEQFLEEFKAY